MSDSQLTVLILAGGAGRRMGGADKGLLHWRGQSLIAQLLSHIDGIPGRRLISCNRNRDIYERYGETVGDSLANFQGPLAGIAAGLASAAQSQQILVLPCDNPRPPVDSYRRLHKALGDSPKAIAYAHDGLRGQYLYALINRACLPELTAFLNEGGRSVHQWYCQMNAVPVDFSDCAEAFTNINDSDALERNP